MSTTKALGKEHTAHENLHVLCKKLQEIYSSAANFEPLTPRPPIIDGSLEIDGDEDSQRRQQENVPGMRLLREAVKSDLERLQSFLADPASVNQPALSTNSPYLISVWNEVTCAPPPVIAIFRTFATDGGKAVRSSHRRDTQSSGIKVDIVCDGGRRWVRVNTIKNSRMLAELREIDSYLTDSEDESDTSEDRRPTLAQKEFDNSVLRMARSLLVAAKENPIPGTTDPPAITLRLTRLDPNEPNIDKRIAETVECLCKMGVNVQLGERSVSEIPVLSALTSSNPKTSILESTTRVNLDLSILIALISDLTHAKLPTSTEEAEARFIPSQKYVDWKKNRINSGLVSKKDTHPTTADMESKLNGYNTNKALNNNHAFTAHARALTTQMIQEMGKGLLQDMFDRLSRITQSSSSVAQNEDREIQNIEFWTTQDARDRCLQILSKIGGSNERRRANALFPSSPASLETLEEQYWLHSRYPQRFIPLLPIRIYPSHKPNGQLDIPLQISDTSDLPSFFRMLSRTCRDVLSQETIPHPRSLLDDPVRSDGGGAVADSLDDGEIQRATVTKANPKLTAHTVQSMLWGSELGWTTLTANKSSVKALLREMKQSGHVGRYDRDRAELSEGPISKAALWIVDPRSLAEGQRADNED